MKAGRIVFYLAMVLALSQVTGLLSLTKQDKAFCLSDGKQTPVEDDDCKEYDDDKDFYFEEFTSFQPIQQASLFHPLETFTFASPLIAIISPPPQA